MFHQREHRLFETELKKIAVKLAAGENLDNEDWRIMGRDGGIYKLKRAFRIPGREDLIRYAVPVILAAIILILLQSWALGFAYILLLGVKWFATVTVIDVKKSAYSVTLFGFRIFGQDI